MAAGKEANFLYSTVDTYIEDAKRDGKEHLVDLWNEMKRDKQKHLSMLRQALEKEAKEQNIGQ
jgi:vacuolar-type H+-ATPase subunit H